MTSFSKKFGGQTISPALIEFSAITFTSTITLQWPKEAVQGVLGLQVASRIVDASAVLGGLALKFPPADQVSVGYTILVNNIGVNNFLIQDNLGGIIVSAVAGESYLVYITDNSGPAGTWRVVQIGAVTAAIVASALAGAGLKVTGSLLALALATTDHNSTYVVGEPDRAEVKRWTGGAGQYTLPDPTTISNDFFFYFRNDGNGILSLVPAAGQINGVPSVSVSPGGSGIVIADGTRYFTVGTGISGTVGFDFISIPVGGGAGDYTLSGAELNRVSYQFTGVLTGNRNIIVPATVQQYWVDNATTGAFTLTVKTAAGSGVTVAQGQRAILYSNGTNVIDADTQGISTPLAIADGGTGAITASAARSNLGATSIGDAVFTAATVAVARAALGAGATGDALFATATAAAARAILAVAGLTDANIFTGVNTIRSSDAGAGEIVALDLDRASATPAANDLLMALRWLMRDGGGGTDVAAKLLAKLLDATAGSEDAELELHTVVAGVPAIRAVFGQGLRLPDSGGDPTGGDPGRGWINVRGGYRVNNVPVAPNSFAVEAGNDVVTADDNGRIIRYSGVGNILVDLISAVTLGAGFRVTLWYDGVTGSATIDPNGAQTLDGQTTRVLRQGDRVTIASDGANWFTVSGVYSFTSADQVISSGAAVVVNHGLGVDYTAKGFKLKFWLRCTANNIGFTAGQLVPLSEDGGHDANGTASRGHSVIVSTTQITVNYGGGSTTPYSLVRPDTFAAAAITNGSWALVIHAEDRYG